MCRSSARGWTVMPGEPASMHTRTASITEGMRPPRELRTVATLLTLTESLGKVFLHDACDLVCPPLNLRVVLALEHDAEQRLGPGIPHQQAAVAGQTLFDALHGVGDRRHLHVIRFLPHPHVDQHLR